MSGLALAAAAVGGFAAGGGFTAAVEPDRTFGLQGTDNAPGASADGAVRATPSGLEVRLDVRGLAPAPEGGYYEAWLRGAEGAVAVGTFHVRRGGEGIVLWSGIEDTQRYDTVAVTLQTEGDGLTSSGMVVLVGPLG